MSVYGTWGDNRTGYVGNSCAYNFDIHVCIMSKSLLKLFIRIHINGNSSSNIHGTDNFYSVVTIQLEFQGLGHFMINLPE